MHRRRRARGHYASTSTYFHPDDLVAPQYCNGRVAHEIADEILVVRSLRSDWEERFALPERDIFDSWLLSDEYIIAIDE
jgi:hypothetical protein